MRRLATLVSTAGLAVVLLGATPVAVSACTSEHPTFVEAVRGARAIARVTIVEGFDTNLDDPTHSETYHVDRVLKGSLPEMVTLAPAWTSLCHDSVGYYAGADGATIIVALDLYYEQTIHPMWMVDATQSLSGSAGVPPGVTTLEGLEAAIRAELGMPDTSTDDAEQESASPVVVVVLVTALAAFGAAVRVFSGPIRTRQPNR